MFLVTILRETYETVDINTLTPVELLFYIREHPEDIMWVDHPSIDIASMAVHSNPKILQFLTASYKANHNIQLVAARADGLSIAYITDPYDDVERAAVKQNGMALRYIKNPDENLIISAITQNPDAIFYIGKPSNAASKLYKRLTGKKI